jgi:hypothetical protein
LTGGGKLKKSLLFLSIILFAIHISAQEYIYVDETLENIFPFRFYFENNNGYLEIFSDSYNAHLINPSKIFALPGEPELHYYKARGQYESRKYKDFLIITFDGREYLFLESKDEQIALLIPLLEDKISPGGKYSGGRWLTFWGINKRLFNSGIFIIALRIADYSSALSESINNETITYNKFAGPFVVDRKSGWVENADGYGIGEYVIVDPAYAGRGIVFLNGFIAPWDPELYYSNSRVKRIKVEYNNIEETIEIEDTPTPQLITFRQDPNTAIKITILDIYPGSLYTDTAISNILFLMQK